MNDKSPVDPNQGNNCIEKDDCPCKKQTTEAFVKNEANVRGKSCTKTKETFSNFCPLFVLFITTDGKTLGMVTTTTEDEGLITYLVKKTAKFIEKSLHGFPAMTDLKRTNTIA